MNFLSLKINREDGKLIEKSVRFTPIYEGDFRQLEFAIAKAINQCVFEKARTNKVSIELVTMKGLDTEMNIIPEEEQGGVWGDPQSKKIVGPEGFEKEFGDEKYAAVWSQAAGVKTKNVTPNSLDKYNVDKKIKEDNE